MSIEVVLAAPNERIFVHSGSLRSPKALSALCVCGPAFGDLDVVRTGVRQVSARGGRAGVPGGTDCWRLAVDVVVPGNWAHPALEVGNA